MLMAAEQAAAKVAEAAELAAATALCTELHDRKRLNLLTKLDLRSLARGLGLSGSGNKPDLLQWIMGAIQPGSMAPSPPS